MARALSRRGFTSTLVAGAAVGAGAALVGTPRIAAAASRWETITRENGIIVSIRPEPGREFPTFRGIGRVNASKWDILAMVEDADRHQEWMHKCVGSKLIDKVKAGVNIVYNRTDAPWPVKDRDIVLKTSVSVARGGKEIWARFKQTTNGKMGPVDGVVRMPTLVGHYKFVAIDEERTMVEYQVNADPGGRIPDFLVKQTTKDLPLHTLANMRKRMKKMAGHYDTAHLKQLIGAG